MKKSIKILCFMITFIFLMVSTLSGCGNKDSGETKNGTTPKAKTEPTSVTQKETVELEVVMHGSAFSENMFKVLFEGFQKAYPNIKLKTEVSNNVPEELLPRIVSGDTPDIYNADLPNLYDLVEEGKILNLNEFYKTKAYDEDKTVLETMLPGSEKAVFVNGGTYAIPYSPGSGGIIVNETMFEENGWKIPTSYKEFCDVSDKILASGKKVMAYGGIAPTMAIEMDVWNGALYDFGGQKACDDIDNLTPGAWKSEPVVKAFDIINKMADKKYLLKDGLGASGSTSQAEFLSGSYAMVASGYWFEMEMKDQIPKGIKLKLIPFPSNENSSDVRAVNCWYNTIKAFSATKHKEEVYDFLRYVLSYEFQSRLGKEGGLTLLTNKKAMEELKTFEKASYFTKSVAEIVTDPKVKLVIANYQWWYMQQIRSTLQDCLRSLINKEMTVEQVCDQMEKNAEKLRNDSTVKKYKVSQ